MSGIITLKTSGGVIATPHNRTQTPHKRKRAIKLLGPACSGKSMVSKMLVDIGARHYSSSTALTEYANKHNHKDILANIKKGNLVDIQHVLRVSAWDFQDFIAHREFGIFDGWGRVPKELEVSVPFLKKTVDIDVLILEATSECLRHRAKLRGRNDDEAIETRIRIYLEHERELKQTAIRLLGEERVHVVETTTLTPDQVKQFVEQKLQLQFN